MKGGRLAAVALAVLAAGCSWPIPRAAAAPAHSAHVEKIPAVVEAPVEREVRYYTDERGARWDDRGINHGPAPSPPSQGSTK